MHKLLVVGLLVPVINGVNYILHILKRLTRTGYSSENPDDFCKSLLRKPGTQELRDWLKKGPCSLGERAPGISSQRYADELYALGADSILVVDVSVDSGGGESSGALVMRLPADSRSRKKVLDWCAMAAHMQGFDAYSDVGQDYVFVMLD